MDRSLHERLPVDLRWLRCVMPSQFHVFVCDGYNCSSMYDLMSGYAASCQFEEVDAKQWAEWKVDYMKEDACGGCRPGGKIDDCNYIALGLATAQAVPRSCLPDATFGG
jgi:hypothetical protein